MLTLYIRNVPPEVLDPIREAAEAQGIPTTNSSLVRWALTQYAEILKAAGLSPTGVPAVSDDPVPVKEAV